MGLTEFVAALVLCLFYAQTVEEPRRLDAQLHSIRGALAALDAQHHTEAELRSLPLTPPPPMLVRPVAADDAPVLPSAAAGAPTPPTPASGQASDAMHVAAAPAAAARHVRLRFASAGTYLYIGVPLEHATGDEGSCWGSAAPGSLDPRTVFEVRPFPGRSAESTDVTLLSLSSSKLLEVGVPGAASTGPKWVLRASVDPGFAASSARFALHGERLWSVATKSFLNNVGGFVRFHSAIDPKDRPSAKSEPSTRLKVEDVGAAALEPYLVLKERSDARIAAAKAHGAALRAAKVKADASTTGDAKPTRITLGVAMTSKGTQMHGVADSPFFNVLMPSFLDTAAAAIADPAKWRFKIHAAWDRNDPVYDAPTELPGHTHFRACFAAALARAHLPIGAVELEVFNPPDFEFPSGAPSQLVSKVLTIAALRDGADYLYQVNDDSHLNSAQWAHALTANLRGNPFLANLGVTGPSDTKQVR